MKIEQRKIGFDQSRAREVSFLTFLNNANEKVDTWNGPENALESVTSLAG